MKPLFRFENLEIWSKAVEIGNKLFDIAERLDRKKFYRFAEQLRAAGLSMSNNIAEGSGSTSSREFIFFLTLDRSQLQAPSPMLLTRGLITVEEKEYQRPHSQWRELWR